MYYYIIIGGSGHYMYWKHVVLCKHENVMFSCEHSNECVPSQ